MFIRILGLFVTIIFSAGATIGAMITMFGAVANRTVEIGTLRALGFHRSDILVAFLGEAFILSLSGGLLGLALASCLQWVTVSTLNFGSFSELAFSFALSPSIIATSLGFSLLMGFIGGFLPALRGGATGYHPGATRGVKSARRGGVQPLQPFSESDLIIRRNPQDVSAAEILPRTLRAPRCNSFWTLRTLGLSVPS